MTTHTEPFGPSTTNRKRARRICLATYDLVGPIRNGGIGTANTALAEALAEDGHEVTILYMAGRYCEKDTMDVHIERYGSLGIRLLPLPECAAPMNATDDVHRSYQAYKWLSQQAFDIIHFHEWRGPGFHSVCAKRLGLAFARTVICVVTHSPVLWHKLNNNDLPSMTDLFTDFIERESVAGADVVLSPSRYLLDWMRDEGWSVPANAIVRQNILTAVPGKPHVDAKALPQRPIEELGFFGRLEPRKGLILFCDAVDRVVRGGRSNFRISFLGKETQFDGTRSTDYIKQRAASWPMSISIVTNLDAQEAQDYLRQPGRMAVITSLAENSPYTVLECLGAGIPFIASNVGGIPELIDAAYHQETLFTPKAPVLARLLDERLAQGHRPAPCAVPLAETKQAWLDWHRELPLHMGIGALAELRAHKTLPFVSVCVVHYNRARLLQQALDSLRAQDYPNFEVIVVDDGSTDAEALAALSSLEPEFAERGWKIIRQENRYPGAARNNAARHARANADYLLFMDDDNYALPHEVRTFVAAAEHSGADIVVCQHKCFTGDEAPVDGETPSDLWGPLGGALAVGVFENAFGDTNALFRKNIYDAIGGFTEHYGVGHEDWELLARAARKGYRIAAIPEALFYYRVAETSIQRRTGMVPNLMRSLSPYLEDAEPWLRQTLLLAVGQHRLLHQPREAMSSVFSTAPVSDHQLLLLKDRVYNSLKPYPRVLNLMRRSVHAVMKATGK